VAQVAAWHPELNIPDLSTSRLLATAHDWLPFYLDDGGRLRSTGTALRKIDLCAAIWSLIPYDLQQQIERLAPSHIVVPTGSHIRLDYRVGAEAPVLSVRLQECFGMKDTPCVNDGKVPVLMELLSPGYKPVQLTRDLSSFCQNTYFEVRGELRRRYPKHYWPDNPLEAEAVRGTKRKC
jgi:ATP-dependent helicase HrpB